MRLGLTAALLLAISGLSFAQETPREPPSPAPETVAEEAEDISFEIPDLVRKPLTLNGYWELRPVVYLLDPDAAQYKVRFGDRKGYHTDYQFNARLLLDTTYEQGASRAFFRTNHALNYTRSSEDNWETDSAVYEGYLSHRATPNLTLDAGKKTLRWGKGYAWNPTAFLDRLKNPEDPELAQEGFIVASADYIRSFSGRLTTFSFTPVLVPVLSSSSERFGRRDTVSAAGKAYFLYDDTDMDLMFIAGADRKPRYGMDFSRNLSPNLELHGEYALLNGFTRPMVGPDGKVATEEIDARSYLLGVRYLNQQNITWIVEYYHNGAGYRPGEMRNYYDFVDSAFSGFDRDGSIDPVRQARSLSEGGYGRQNPMRDYLYFRASQPDAFDVLYLTPAVFGIFNLNDRSFALTQETAYRPEDNTEYRMQISFISGGGGTEYGEKQNDLRVEFRSRLFF
jgi:hypothetical protein